MVITIQGITYDSETGIVTKANGTQAGWDYKTHAGKTYRKLYFDGKICRAHRLAVFFMTGAWPEGDIDHEDGNGLNNAWSNIRAVSNAENHRNCKMLSVNKSGVNGVHWDKRYNKWRVKIGPTFLGRFDSFEEATRVRREAEIEHGYHPNHGTKRSL